MRGIAGLIVLVAVASCDLVFPPGTGPGGEPPPAEWRQVSAAFRDVCAIGGDDSLWCWGRNDLSEVGDNSTIDRNAPTKIGGTAKWSSVSAGDFHSCAIQTDGGVYCWGYDFTGELGGGGAPSPRTVPTQIVDHAAWAEVAAGSRLTCGIKAADATLWCWGANDKGQLGTDIAGPSSTPTEVKNGGAWLHVAAGGAFACGIKMDSTLWCWGSNYYQQLGQNGSDSPKPESASPDPGWTAIVAGELHACGLRGGVATCWGYNGDGEVGNDTATTPSPPAAVVSSVTEWVALDAGYRHTCGVAAGGGLWCWGLRERGVFAGSTDSIVAEPAPVELPSTRAYTAPSTGGDVTCAIGDDGVIDCTGANNYGQLGDGTGGARFAPVRVADNATAIAAGGSGGGGGDFTCAALADGVSCWGADDAYQFGDGLTVDSQLPRLRDAQHPDAIVLGSGNGCELRGTALWCWGYNVDGAVGDNTFAPAPHPVSVGQPWTTVRANRHACALGTGNDLWCWGANDGYQLGDGSTDPEGAPVWTTWGVPIAAVATGGQFTCAIDTDGSAWCWGTNTEGQLGVGDRNARPDPTLLTTSDTWTAIDAGEHHTCAISATTQRISCWGYNAFGAVGDGSTSDADVPTPIDSPLRWRMVSTGGYHTCAIATGDDSLWCWGANQDGQVGVSGPAVVTSPVEVSSDHWSTVDAGEAHSCALRKADASVWCWGFDARGEIGDGSAWRAALAPVGTQ